MRRTPQLVKGRHTSKGSHLSVSGMTVVFEFFRDLRSSRVASLDLQQTMALSSDGGLCMYVADAYCRWHENPKAEALST